MFGKAITYKTTKKCLADNRTAKYEASDSSVGPDEFQILWFICSLFCTVYWKQAIKICLLNNNKILLWQLKWMVILHEIFFWIFEEEKNRQLKAGTHGMFYPILQIIYDFCSILLHCTHIAINPILFLSNSLPSKTKWFSQIKNAWLQLYALLLFLVQ